MFKRLMLVFALMLLLQGCSVPQGQPEKDKQLVVYSPHPLEFIDPIISEFETEYGIQVSMILLGTGELLSRIELESDEPQGDVLWGGSLSTLAPKKHLFEPYRSINEDHVHKEFQNTDGYTTRFSLIPSVIMVNKNLIGDTAIRGYRDLLMPSFKSKIAMADPSKSSSAYEHLINQLYAMGEGSPDNGWWYVDAFINQLDGRLLDGSPEVYRGVAEGKYTVGLTFEEAAAIYVKDGAPVEIVYPEEGTIAKADGVSIIKSSKNMENAKLFIDFVTSKDIQQLIATELNRRSIRVDIGVSEGLKKLSDLYIIFDDLEWSATQRDTILEAFRKKFQGE